MMVSTTLANVVLVADCVDVEDGDGESLVGISPARAVTDINPVRAIAITRRFMF